MTCWGHRFFFGVGILYGVDSSLGQNSAALRERFAWGNDDCTLWYNEVERSSFTEQCCTNDRGMINNVHFGHYFWSMKNDQLWVIK
jgi:hypothetical protein